MNTEDFVALALAEELASGPAQYGYAMRVASDNPSPPAVVALTWIVGAAAAGRERIRAFARETVQDFLAEPGFISIVTGFIGLRGFTVTAWESEEALERGLSGHHAVAMRALFGETFVASVWTSVWTPARTNRLWVRCPACGTLESAADDAHACTRCGAPSPPRPAYW